MYQRKKRWKGRAEMSCNRTTSPQCYLGIIKLQACIIGIASIIYTNCTVMYFLLFASELSRAAIITYTGIPTTCT
jgi:hypothetical protein